MWNKIYSAILAAAVLAMGVLLYLPYSWLQSITAPTNVAINYKHYSNISWTFLFVSALILLIAGNVVLWKTRHAWAMWASLLYFVIFTIAHTFWLEGRFFQYKQQTNLTTEIISFTPVYGVIFIILAAIIVFFNQYLVKRMRDKMYPIEAQPVEAMPDEPLPDDKNV